MLRESTREPDDQGSGAHRTPSHHMADPYATLPGVSCGVSQPSRSGTQGDSGAGQHLQASELR